MLQEQTPENCLKLQKEVQSLKKQLLKAGLKVECLRKQVEEESRLRFEQTNWLRQQANEREVANWEELAKARDSLAALRREFAVYTDKNPPSEVTGRDNDQIGLR